MLAHFEHFYFAFEKFEIFQRELFLFDNLNSTLLLSLFVNCGLNKSIFTLAKVVSKLVVVV